MQGSTAPYFCHMLGRKRLTLMVRVILVLFALLGQARPLQHALHHDETHHGERSDGPLWNAQCADCELDRLPVEPVVLQRLALEKDFCPALRSPLSGRLMGDKVRGMMGRAPPDLLS
jgi:hypothetical protein